MALNAYLKMTGETQGEVDGGVTKAGREGTIEVYGWSHEVVSPRDAASGLPTGKRQHKPFTITKNIDRSTPLLYALLTRNENITDWELRCWRPSASGAEENFYTVQLANASIVRIAPESLNNRYEENMAHAEREHVSFVYQKITWTYVDGGVTAEDDWGTTSV